MHQSIFDTAPDSRVLLSSSFPQSTYINANYIKVWKALYCVCICNMWTLSFYNHLTKELISNHGLMYFVYLQHTWHQSVDSPSPVDDGWGWSLYKDSVCLWEPNQLRQGLILVVIFLFFVHIYINWIKGVLLMAKHHL